MIPFWTSSCGAFHVTNSEVAFNARVETFNGGPVGTAEKSIKRTCSNRHYVPSCGSWKVTKAAGPEATVTAVTVQV